MAEPSPAPAQTSPGPGRAAWPEARLVRWALGALLGVTVFRLWFITHLQLIPDEAYYWLWSKNLALSYRDKGPLVAWAIALGTKLFGDTTFGIRVFAVLLGTGTSWQVFRLARRLYDLRTALWGLALVTLIPLFAAESVLMTIDPLSIFFWAWAMNVFWTALESGKSWHWLALGCLIGLGFLAKFTNGVQLMCIALFLCWSKPHRRFLISRQTIAMCAVFVATISPLLWWNAQNGWVHVGALHSRSGVDTSFQIRPGEFLKFAGGEFAVFSPLLAVGLVVATIGLLWKQHGDLRTRFLLCQFLPLTGIFFFFSLNKAGKENWPAPGLLAGVVLLVVFWRSLVARSPRWRWAVYPALGVAALMTVFGHHTEWLGLPAPLDPLRRTKGWDDFAAHVQQARAKYPGSLLIGNHYDQASMMTYYLPDHPRTYLREEKYGKSQFSLWPGYDGTTNTRALYVTTGLKTHSVPAILQRDFPKCEVVDEFQTQHHGRPMMWFTIYLCQRE